MNQYRRGSYRVGRHNWNNRWQSQSQQNNWKKRQNVFCDFHNSSTHSSEERRNHPKNKKQKSDQHAKVSNIKKKKMTKVFTSWKTLWKTQKKMTTGILTLALHATCQVMQEYLAVLKKSYHELDCQMSWSKSSLCCRNVSFRAFIDNQPFTGICWRTYFTYRT
jgi:hypothetical protein